MANSYTINLTDGTFDFIINEKEVISDHGLTFTGRGVVDYGQHRNTNLLHLLEHFANTVAPTNPVVGQLWFDTNINLIQIWDGAIWDNVSTDDFLISGTYVVNDGTGEVNIPKALTADVIIDNIATYTNFQNHVNDPLDAHNATAISFDDTSLPFVAVDLQEAIEDVQNELDLHLADPVDAHDASAISFIPYLTISSTNVQGAIQQLEDEVDVLDIYISNTQTTINNHITDPIDAHDATAISYDNSLSGLTATNVQDAIDEIEFEATSGGGSGVVDYVRTQMTANQLIDAGTGSGAFGVWSKLLFNSIVFGDTLGNYSTVNSRYVADRDMEIRVRAYALYDNVGDNQNVYIRVRKNGVTTLRQGFDVKKDSSVSNATTTVEISVMDEISAGDYIEIEGVIQSFGAVTITDRFVLSSSAFTGFEVEVLRDNTP